MKSRLHGQPSTSLCKDGEINAVSEVKNGEPWVESLDLGQMEVCKYSKLKSS